MLLALMLMYNGKTHYFFMVQRGSVVFVQKRLLDGNKLIKKFYLYLFFHSLFFVRSAAGFEECECQCYIEIAKTKGCRIKYKQQETLTTKHIHFVCIDTTKGRRSKKEKRTSEKKTVDVYDAGCHWKRNGLNTLMKLRN